VTSGYWGYCFKSRPIYRISAEITVFYSKRSISAKFYQISFWTDIGR